MSFAGDRSAALSHYFGSWVSRESLVLVYIRLSRYLDGKLVSRLLTILYCAVHSTYVAVQTKIYALFWACFLHVSGYKQRLPWFLHY